MLSRAPDDVASKIEFYYWYMGWLLQQTNRLAWLRTQVAAGKDIPEQDKIFWAAFTTILNAARRDYLTHEFGWKRVNPNRDNNLKPATLICREFSSGGSDDLDRRLYRKRSSRQRWIPSSGFVRGAVAGSRLNPRQHAQEEEQREMLKKFIETAQEETRVTGKLRHIALFEAHLTDKDKRYLAACQARYVERPEGTFWNGEAYLPWDSLDHFLLEACAAHAGRLPWTLVGYLLATKENSLTKRLHRLLECSPLRNENDQGETGLR